MRITPTNQGENMNHNQAVIAVLNKALTLLWDGKGDEYYYDSDTPAYKEKHGCHVVTWADSSIRRGEDILFSCIYWREAEAEELVVELHARIKKYIGGYDTAAQYIRSQTGEWPDNATTQAFRKKMLEEIKAEYEAREAA